MIEKEQLAATTPDAVVSYLQHRGWTEVYRDGGGTAWAQQSVEPQGNPELWVPRSRQMKGYLNRIASLVDSLGEFERRSPMDILFEIAYTFEDVQLFRSMPEGPSGTIPLEVGSDTLNGIEKWVTAGAAFVARAEPSPVLPRRQPVLVENFMHRVKLVAPARGSFVWKVAIPLTGAQGMDSLPFEELIANRDLPTFNRRVTRRLYDATSAVLAACDLVRQGNSVLGAFHAAVSEGVTANLCEGLSGAGGDRHTPYEISFKWASTLPSPDTDVLRFGGGELEIVRQAAEEFRRSAPEEDVQLRGYIVRLGRDSEQRPGVVTLAGTAVGDTEQGFGHFSFELTDEDYADALASHADHRIVMVRGDVVRRGTRRHLERVRDFRIIGEESDD